VRSIKMRLADDSIVECGPDEESELFWATVGGMGLTGHILEVEFTMKSIPSPWIWRESTRVRDLAEYMDSLNAAAPRWPMTVGWIDCVCKGSALGRGILDAGRWATAEEAGSRALKQGPSIKFPIDLPDWCVNGFTVAAFNTAYYWKQFDERITGLATPNQFFYPLDGILEWNRGYGKRGFTQYQCVIPRAAGNQGVTDFMQLLTKLGGGSPLSVIKDCGPQGRGMLSFPLEGTSIAVDLVVTPELQGIVDRLNEFMIELGGRVYLTKDRFTRPEHFRAMEPRLDAFLAVREKYDPKRRLRSGQSVRLFGDKASAFGAE
jgi:FAD/FMN-containing dehydrogenase